MADATTWPGLWLRLAGRALLNPRAGLDLLALTWAFRRRHWWRKPPFLPLPDPEYLAWRLHTAYGEEREVPPAQDILRFARWRRRLLRP
jgi:hypothetical protein